MFQQLPTAGLPFQFAHLGGVRGATSATAHVTGVIEELTDVRWDIRPAPHLGTLENRICDGVSTFADLSALVALIHCLVVDLDTRLAAGETLPMMPLWHVQENKWRAARYGLDAIVITRRRHQRAAAHRRPGRPRSAASTRSAERLGCSAELASSWTSRRAGRRTSDSGRSPRVTTATSSRWWTPSSRNCAKGSSRSALGAQLATMFLAASRASDPSASKRSRSPRVSGPQRLRVPISCLSRSISGTETPQMSEVCSPRQRA